MSENESQQAFTQMIKQLGQQMVDAGQLMQDNAERFWFNAQRQSLMMQEISDAITELSKNPQLLQQYQQQIFQAFSLPNDSQVEQKDRRFQHEAWQQPGFAELKQLYLSFSQLTQQLFNDLPEQDAAKKQRQQFYIRQWLSAISPSNYLMTNPEALQQAQNTNGLSVLQGIQNYLDDMKRNKGMQNIRMTDLSAFELGKNIACTPGSVIFQNDLFQLIQYTPTTQKVAQKPLLVVPPWINKYYILDLQAHNSWVKWVVDQGFTVFMISWVNPDKQHKHLAFDDYMKQGVVEATNAIEQHTGEQAINAVGYCLGGTLLGCTLAYMKAKGDQRIQSATFFTTLLDFSDPGELGCFISEQQLDILEQQMAHEGVLDGRSLALAYNMLRENELHWSYHVNNYLLGKEPPVFDLLYWNSDATNLPANMHRFYLRNMYQENRLKDPGGITLDGTAIDIIKIDIPSYFLSAQKDHIALWKSTYLGAQQLSGDVEFVLSGSGHVAGVINPPENQKYSYFTHPEISSSADNWLSAAQETEGSWWEHWRDWLKQHSGDSVAARAINDGKLPALEPAPGEYVKKKC